MGLERLSGTDLEAIYGGRDGPCCACSQETLHRARGWGRGGPILAVNSSPRLGSDGGGADENV
jgi:hypothetical protein